MSLKKVLTALVLTMSTGAGWLALLPAQAAASSHHSHKGHHHHGHKSGAHHHGHGHKKS